MLLRLRPRAQVRVVPNGGLMLPASALRTQRFPGNPKPIPGQGRLSSCELFGIDAYAEDDLGYAPS